MDNATLIAGLPDLRRARDALRQQIVEKTQKRADLDREIKADCHEEAALNEIISGIERLVPHNELASQDEAAAETAQADVFEKTGGSMSEAGAGGDVEISPRGGEALKQVMADGQPWTLQDLISQIVERGWIRPDARNPASAVRESVRRLAAAGVLEKVAHATYRLASAAAEIPSTQDGNLSDIAREVAPD